MNEELNIPEDCDNLERHAPTLAKIRKENPFSVPENYFEGLNSAIKLEVLKNGTGGFTVPENYFNDLPEIIQSKIFISEFKKDVEVPEGYFDTLADKIQSEIFISELPKGNPFTVPQNYFEELPTVILQKAIQSQKKEAKIISLFTRKNLIWSAVASIAIILGLNLFINRGVEDVNDKKIIEVASLEKKSIIENSELYNISEADIIDALEANGESISEKVEISDEDKEAIDFLLDNGIDINAIANE